MKKLLLSFMMVFCAIILFAQTNTVLKGTVKGNKDEALPGATVLYVEGGKTALTDEAGMFTFSNLPAQVVTLQVSYTGYTVVTTKVDLTKGNVANTVITLKYDPLSLTDVVVTGTTGARPKLATSVSTSSIRYDEAVRAAPRTTAEIFRNIPGIKAEASGGDGNTNITVRGIPISAGGSKYLQLQEDGLPVLQFGDIAFATADIFLRADQSIGRIEAIRGGSASTLATNSPAGIINFISKTGGTNGGSIALTSGLDFNTTRTDFNYGGSLSDDVSFHIGGFYRSGEGPRTAGYTANNGAQIKMNFTKKFKSGYARVYLKYLN
ncbi:MAG: carboxypeptidase-like regulatory domain-containing protein, partial [Chitinophagaceae bacterium]